MDAADAVADDFGGGDVGGESLMGGGWTESASSEAVLGGEGVEAVSPPPVSEWMEQRSPTKPVVTPEVQGLSRTNAAPRALGLRKVQMRLLPAQASSLLSMGVTEVITITYDYDPLNRLTDADYSDGTYFDYTYDSVGNRLTESTQAGTTSYGYDVANRLTSVGGVTTTWDANGNLLSDGVNTYTYDASNRLKAVSGAGYAASYLYNGMGDRLSQTVDSVTTEYTLDLHSGLTQVLADETNTYLYGRGRVGEEQPGGFVLHLGDALGSVRQVVDGTGEVILAKDYKPYGEVLSASGSGETSLGFTGEVTDSSGMVYLRARYYQPSTGRFQTRDTWAGDYNQPMSYNTWLYTYANPVNNVDPGGTCPDNDGDGKCDPGWWCEQITNPEIRWLCYQQAGCNSELCPPPPIVTHEGPVHQSYKALVETPCERKNGKLYPWWKTKNALQKGYGSMDITMLIAVLVYTEASPIRPGALGSNEDVRDAWTAMAANRYAYHCSNTGPCNITDNGRQLGYGLSQFLSWSPRFRYWDKNYASLGTSSIYEPTSSYGNPKWAYDVAKNVVGLGSAYDPNGPFGGMNTQTGDEQEHFLNAFKQYGKKSTLKEGVYYMWPANPNTFRKPGDLVILTSAQETYHCGPNKEKFPCGSTVKK
jgi:RHS repeat-associated protein